MKVKKKLFAGTGALMCALICLTALMPAYGADSGTGGFSIRAILPENQADKKQTYFDLRMEPGQEQTLELVIANSRQMPLEATIELNPATTGRNGLILYSAATAPAQGVDIRSIASLRHTRVSVPAGGTHTVEIDLKMPDEPIEGVVLGGITVSEAPEEGAADTSGVTVKNAIAYVVALKLSQSDELPSPDFSLDSVAPALTNYRTTVVARVSNLSSRVVKDMKVNAQVYRSGGATPLRTLELDSADMAPASAGDFVIDWNSEPLREGDYRLKMTAAYDGKIWEWDEGFSIGGEAGEINGAAVGLKRDYTWYFVAGGAVLLVLVWIIAFRRGRKERESE